MSNVHSNDSSRGEVEVEASRQKVQTWHSLPIGPLESWHRIPDQKFRTQLQSIIYQSSRTNKSPLSNRQLYPLIEEPRLSQILPTTQPSARTKQYDGPLLQTPQNLERQTRRASGRNLVRHERAPGVSDGVSQAQGAAGETCGRYRGKEGQGGEEGV